MTLIYTLLCAVKVAVIGRSSTTDNRCFRLNINQNGPVTTKTQGGRSLKVQVASDRIIPVFGAFSPNFVG